MKGKWKGTAGAVFLIFVTLLTAKLVIDVLSATARWFSNLGSDSAGALAGLVGVVLVAGITYVSNRVLERRRSVEATTRAKRVELYDEFVTFFMSMFGPKSLGKRPTPKALTEFMADVTPRLIVYGSNDVVRRWGKLRSGTLGSPNPEPENSTAAILEVEQFLVAIRKDLGHGSFTARNGDLLRLWVNDVDRDILKRKS